MSLTPPSLLSRALLAAATALALAAPTAARAEPGDEQREGPEAENPAYGRELRFEVSAYGGYHFFAHEHSLGRTPATVEISRGDLSPANSGTFGARLELNFNRWVGLEGELAGYSTHTNNHQSDMWIFGYRGSLIVHLSPYYHFRPFVLLGYGGLTSLVANEEAPASGASPAANDTYGFLHAGLGFKIGFTDMTGLRLEGRIMGPWTALDPVIPRGNRVVASGPDYELLAGLYLAFGEIAKERYYSQKEIRVIAPPEPKTKDRDGDGILDDVDKCPDAPEDRDGFEDNDGCPDPDNDKDGIPDVRDKCPNDAEDKDGFEDDDGCPDPDNDKDGIPDASDKCPNEPETINNVDDEDGCPDKGIVTLKENELETLTPIFFDTDRARVKHAFRPALDVIAAILKAHPEIGRCAVEGHTDATGPAEWNKKLSLERAKSVAVYLISKGVDPSRVAAIGQGDALPWATNQTEAGRAANRRVIFHLEGVGEDQEKRQLELQRQRGLKETGADPAPAPAQPAGGEKK